MSGSKKKRLQNTSEELDYKVTICHLLRHFPSRRTSIDACAPRIHQVDNWDKRLAEFGQEVFRLHRHGVMHYAVHNADGFQFAKLL